MYMISGIYSSVAQKAGRNSSGIICQGKACRVAIAHGTSEHPWLLAPTSGWPPFWANPAAKKELLFPSSCALDFNMLALRRNCFWVSVNL